MSEDFFKLVFYAIASSLDFLSGDIRKDRVGGGNKASLIDYTTPRSPLIIEFFFSEPLKPTLLFCDTVAYYYWKLFLTVNTGRNPLDMGLSTPPFCAHGEETVLENWAPLVDSRLALEFLCYP